MAIVLGAAGAVPFLALSFATPFIAGSLREQTTLILTAYGAVILSFLGGIHWGLAINTVPAAAEEGRLFRRLACSVVPALIGWVAFLMPTAVSLSILAVAFVAVLCLDLIAARNGEAPEWYPRLRVPLTVAVVLSLITGVLADAVGV
jgi:uncharacterized membrane protein